MRSLAVPKRSVLANSMPVSLHLGGVSVTTILAATRLKSVVVSSHCPVRRDVFNLRQKRLDIMAVMTPHLALGKFSEATLFGP